MPEEREWLRLIAERPEDPAPRRAYADWLVEQGGPRGEDIRAWREHLPVWDPRWSERFKPGSPYGETLSRLGFASYTPGPEGLPDRVLVDAERYSAEGRDPAFLATARKLTVLHPHAWPFEFHASPWLDGVTVLTFQIDERRWAADGVGEAGARALAAALRAPRLARLSLRGNSVGDAGAAALAASPALARLEALDLGGGFPRDSLDGPPPGNHVGDEGARALANSPHLPALKELDLAFGRVGDEGMRALANSTHLTALTSLNLAHNVVGDEGMRALASSPHLPALKSLNLVHNVIGDEGARALATARALPSLKALHLDNNRIGYPGAWALVGSPLGDRLESLGLSNNRIGLRSWSFTDWDGTVVGGQVGEDLDDPEWPRLRQRMLRFLPIDFRYRYREPPPPD